MLLNPKVPIRMLLTFIYLAPTNHRHRRTIFGSTIHLKVTTASSAKYYPLTELADLRSFLVRVGIIRDGVRSEHTFILFSNDC